MTYLTIYILASANGFYGIVLWTMVIGGGLLIDSILEAERNQVVVDDDEDDCDYVTCEPVVVDDSQAKLEASWAETEKTFNEQSRKGSL